VTRLPAPPPEPRRLVYLGTPALAVGPLRALHTAGYDIPLVVSAPDRRRGRGGATMPSPVKAAAVELGLDVTSDPDAVLDVGADLGVVVAFGRLIKPHLLEALPFVNLHFSLLPRWRGAAPVERAILAGDDVTGVCLMVVEEDLDTGGVYASRTTPVADKSLESLRAELVDDGTELLLDALSAGFGVAHPQDGEPTYAAKIEPSEHRIDWRRDADDVRRTIRIGDAWTTFRDKRLKLRTAIDGGAVAGLPGQIVGSDVACGDGLALRLVEVQPEGKQPMSTADWRNGAQPSDGERFE
jgi:methionyl-tRNA formyltransferase